MADIRRSLGTAREGKAPLVTAELGRLVRLSGPTPLAEARDWVLFLVGFAAGLRRSELVAVNVRDLEESEHDLPGARAAALAGGREISEGSVFQARSLNSTASVPGASWPSSSAAT
jgi:integrase